MNNHQDNFIYNPQKVTTPDSTSQSINNEQFNQNNQNAFLPNTNQPLNVIPIQNNLNQNNTYNQQLNQPDMNNIKYINSLNSQNITDNKFMNFDNSNNQDNINNNYNTNLNINNNIVNETNSYDNQNVSSMNLNNIPTNINNLNNIAINQDNNRMNFNGVFSNQISSIRDNIPDEDYKMLNPQPDNKYINSNFDTTSTTLTDLNVDPNAPRVDYSNDPKVQAHIKENEKRKNTITITSEAKIFLLIVVVLFLFIFVMPYIFDAIRTIG